MIILQKVNKYLLINNLHDLALHKFLSRSNETNEIFNYYCSKIYFQSQEMYESYNSSSSKNFMQDLFIEQSMY